jgi:hypothetical protein
MHKKNLLFLGFLLICSVSLAQTINWGQNNISPNDKYSPEILSTDDNFVYTLTYDYKDFFVEKFDKAKLTPVYSKVVEIPKIGTVQTSLELISLVNDRFVVFYSYYNEQENVAELHAYTIDAASGDKTGRSVRLMQLPVEKKKRDGEFYAFVSEDRKKILINHYCYFRSQKMHQDKYVLFDANLEVILERSEKFEKDDINYRTFNYTIDNDGSVYYIKSSDEGYSIVSYDAHNDYEKWEEKIDLSKTHPNAVIKSVHLSFNSKNNLVLTGLYTISDKYEGLIYMCLDRFSKEITVNKIDEFDAGFKETIGMNRPKAPRNMAYNRMMSISKADGGTIVIGEQYRREIIQTRNSTTVHTYFVDLVLFDLNAQGDLLRSYRIPKYQADHSSLGLFFTMKRIEKKCEYLSVLPWLDNKFIYLAFNDNAVNVSQTAMEAKYKAISAAGIEKAVPVIVKINRETGELSKEAFTSLSKADVVFKPQIHYVDPGNNSLIVFAQRKLNYRLGTMVTE